MLCVLVLTAVLGLQHSAIAQDRVPQSGRSGDVVTQTADVAASLGIDVIGNPRLYGAIAQMEQWSISAEAAVERQQSIVTLADGVAVRVRQQLQNDQAELNMVASGVRSDRLTAAIVEMRDHRAVLDERVERQTNALATADKVRARETEQLETDLDQLIEIWNERQRILSDLTDQLAREDDRTGSQRQLSDEALAGRVLRQIAATEQIHAAAEERAALRVEGATVVGASLDTTEAAGPAEMRWPAIGAVNSGFGMRVHPIYRRNIMHTGIDIDAPWGDPVLAVSDGVVTEAHWKGGYGNAVVVDHGDGVTSLYSHLAELHVQPGDVVVTSGQLGLVGATGTATDAHLHFEVRVNNEAVDPLDYLP